MTPTPSMLQLGNVNNTSDADKPVSTSQATALAGKVSKDEILINAKDYGATPGIDVDQSAALNAANAAAETLGARMFVPSGTYRIDLTVEFRASTDASLATFNFHGTGVALKVGKDVGVISNRAYWLPSVQHSVGAVWDGVSVGIEMVNLNTCQVYCVGFVRNFEYGYRFIGRGTGFAYNTVILGYTNQNRVGHHLTQNESGWCNQNTFIGGRTQVVSARGAVADDPGCHYFLFEGKSNSVSGPNNNTFTGCTMEGTNFSYYRMKFVGSRYNLFTNCRWERYGSVYRIQYLQGPTAGSGSAWNVIQYGYDAWQIVEEYDAASSPGGLFDGVGGVLSARTGGTTTAPNNVATVVKSWATRTVNRGEYSADTGAWTPRAGVWNIRAKATFNGTAATGTCQATLRTLAGVVLDIAKVPATTTGATVTLGATYRVPKGESIVVEILQTTGADLATNGFTGWTTFDAVMVNG
ncbi:MULTISPECIES: glycosyl hydrolase family 28-related protein [unclassified Arthrobacter]|uniref:glycosyl hydrolase family 28-related protein n=1 Tax=unclassified Arthrobacter TaxID=235627 RepID=UPI001491347E|nr:glycosyl hydrolase family 28-related protein [Arthrobacter sp. AET 35A]NOJ63358.1 hypothetical protein [Arthrobacter sp. 147(2020)]